LALATGAAEVVALVDFDTSVATGREEVVSELIGAMEEILAICIDLSSVGRLDSQGVIGGERSMFRLGLSGLCTKVCLYRQILFQSH
jgi:hypothetical protein